MLFNKKVSNEEIMETINALATQMTVFNDRLTKLEESATQSEKSNKKTAPKTKKTSTKNTPKEKAKSKGKSSKKNAPSNTKKPTTYAEAMEKWEKDNNITEESKKAYGKACQDITAAMRKENEKMVTIDENGKKIYDKNYYIGYKWKKEFDKRLVAMGHKPKYKIK